MAKPKSFQLVMGRPSPKVLGGMSAFLTLLMGASIWAATNNVPMAVIGALVGGLSIWVLCITLWFMMVFATAVPHEFGHWVAGRLNGLVLYNLTIWPFDWLIKPSRTLRLNWNSQVLGSVHMWAPDGSVDLKRRARMIWGGPIASILCCILFGLGALWVNDHVAKGFFVYLILFTLSTGVAGLYPRKALAYETDGYQLRRIRQEPLDSTALNAIGHANFLVLHQVPGWQWPTGLDEIGFRTRNPRIRIQAYNIFAPLKFQTGGPDQAARFIQRATEEADEWLSEPRNTEHGFVLKAWAAMAIAFYNLNPEKAQSVLPDGEDLSDRAQSALDSARAAILVIRDRQDEAKQLLSQAEEATKRLSDPSHRTAAFARINWVRKYNENYQAMPENVRSLSHAWCSSVRPRDWKAEWLQNPIPESDRYWGFLALADLVYKIDCGEPTLVKECIDRLVKSLAFAKLEGTQKPRIWSEIACYYSLELRDLPAASHALRNAETAPWIDSPSLLTAQAAVLALSGKQEEAVQITNEIQAIMDSIPDWVPKAAEDVERLETIRALALSQPVLS